MATVHDRNEYAKAGIVLEEDDIKDFYIKYEYFYLR